MLMLYLISAEIFDLGLNYSYSSERVEIADTQENRDSLIHHQFGGHNRSVVKRSVLLGARVLTLKEVRLLEASAGTTDRLWLVTKIATTLSVPLARSLPRLLDESDMYELLENSPERYDPTPLTDDQYIHSSRFSKIGSATSSVRVAA